MLLLDKYFLLIFLSRNLPNQMLKELLTVILKGAIQKLKFGDRNFFLSCFLFSLLRLTTILFKLTFCNFSLHCVLLWVLDVYLKGLQKQPSKVMHINSCWLDSEKTLEKLQVKMDFLKIVQDHASIVTINLQNGLLFKIIMLVDAGVLKLHLIFFCFFFFAVNKVILG